MKDKNEKQFSALVVGQESLHNLRLANLLRKLLGKEYVFRYLNTRHMVEFLSQLEDTNYPIGIFYDLFSFELNEAVNTIGYVRSKFHQAVFCLYLNYIEADLRWDELPLNWQNRLDHYFKLYKDSEDAEMEPIVRQTLSTVMGQAILNVVKTPLRLTDNSEDNSLPTHIKKPTNKVFVSYSRTDWESFVLPLINRLKARGFSIWVDQHLLLGGDDWMDAIGEALDTRSVLLLVMSQEALGSKFVRMEYRYFFNHDKPIVPLLYRSVERIPPELAVTQYIDFKVENDQKAFTQLIQVLETHAKNITSS